MQKRAFQRIHSNIRIKFHCNSNDYSGTISDISENGMFIRTKDVCFPFDSEFTIVLPLNKKVLKVSVKVSRMTKTGECYDGIGVEVSRPSQRFLKFVNDLRAGS